MLTLSRSSIFDLPDEENYMPYLSGKEIIMPAGTNIRALCLEADSYLKGVTRYVTPDNTLKRML